MTKSTSEKIWDAVSDALDDNATVIDFVREAEEAWLAMMKERVKDAEKDWEKRRPVPV